MFTVWFAENRSQNPDFSDGGEPFSTLKEADFAAQVRAEGRDWIIIDDDKNTVVASNMDGVGDGSEA